MQSVNGCRTIKHEICNNDNKLAGRIVGNIAGKNRQIPEETESIMHSTNSSFPCTNNEKQSTVM